MQAADARQTEGQGSKDPATRVASNAPLHNSHCAVALPTDASCGDSAKHGWLIEGSSSTGTAQASPSAVATRLHAPFRTRCAALTACRAEARATGAVVTGSALQRVPCGPTTGVQVPQEVVSRPRLGLQPRANQYRGELRVALRIRGAHFELRWAPILQQLRVDIVPSHYKQL